MQRILFLSLAASFGVPRLVVAQETEAMKKQIAELLERVGELEDSHAKFSDRLGNRAVAQSYSARSLDLGGHVSSLFTYIDGASDSEAGHVVTLLELYFRAQLDDEWSLFATPGFYTYNGAILDNPITTSVAGDPYFIADESSDARIFLARAYAEWRSNDLFGLQAGVVGSPHGTTNREYFIPARTIGLPNMSTRIFLANQLYPQSVEGGRVSGKYVLDAANNRIEYDGYLGTEDDSATDAIGGARVAYVHADWGLSVAANYGRGTREATASGLTGADAVVAILNNVPQLQSPFAARSNGGRDYEFVGVDVDWRHGRWVSKSEAYISSEGPYQDQRAFSTECTCFVLPEWGVSYRFDYYDAGSDLTVVSLAPFTLIELSKGHSTEHAVGVCYNPNPSVRLRLDLHRNNLPNTDDTADFLNLSWSISF